MGDAGMTYTVHASGLFAAVPGANGAGPRRADRRCLLTATSVAGAEIAAVQVLVGELAALGLTPVEPVQTTVADA
jgi:hypothetical protein